MADRHPAGVAVRMTRDLRRVGRGILPA